MEHEISKSGKSTYWLIAVAIIVLAGLAYIFRPGSDDPKQITQNNQQVLIIPGEERENQDVTQADSQNNNLDFASQLPVYEGEGLELDLSEPLPELAKSDPQFSQDILALSPQLKPVLFKRQLIRKSIFSINDISQGMRPQIRLLRELSFTKSFTVNQEGDKMYMSEESYQRYDHLAQAVDSIDSQAAAELYQKYLPLFEQVFAEFSYPENYRVLDIIKAATAKILDAPVINERIELIRPSVRYKFANPRLEKLSALDKQMLRMGPDNTQIIQDKLRELIQALIQSEKD